MSITYKGVHLSDLSLDAYVSSAGRNAGAPADNQFLSIAGRDGDYPVIQDDRAKVITVLIRVHTASPAALRSALRALAGWLKTTKDEFNEPIPEPLIFDDEPDKRYMAFVENEIRAEDFVGSSDLLVSFVCPSPYAEALNTKTTGASSTNNGTVPTPPIITVTVSTSMASLKVQLGTRYLLLGKALSNNDVVVFDKAKRLVTVNTVDARGDLHYTRRWFDLPPGAFTITTDPVSGLSVQVEFRERWR